MVQKKERNILILKYILIIILSSLPINIYVIFSINVDYNIIRYLCWFVAFYMFSFSLVFHIDKFKPKVIITTFLFFLLICLLNYSFNFFNISDLSSIDLSSIFSNDVELLNNYIIKNIFLFIIFFIILMFSYTDFNISDTKKQSEFFTTLGDTLFCLILLLTASSVFLTIFFYSFFILIATTFLFFQSSSFTDFLISKGFISIIITIYSAIPFIAYIMNKSFKINISVYISRFFMIILFLLSFIFINMLIDNLHYYSNKSLYYMLFVIFNIFFIRLDLKSRAIIKIIYFLLLVSSFIVCLFMIVNNIYYIVENSFNYLFILKISIFIHIVFLLYLFIRDFIFFINNNSIKDFYNTSLSSDSVGFIYFYLFLYILFLLPFIRFN